MYKLAAVLAVAAVVSSAVIPEKSVVVPVASDVHLVQPVYTSQVLSRSSVVPVAHEVVYNPLVSSTVVKSPVVVGSGVVPHVVAKEALTTHHVVGSPVVYSAVPAVVVGQTPADTVRI